MVWLGSLLGMVDGGRVARMAIGFEDAVERYKPCFEFLVEVEWRKGADEGHRGSSAA